MAGTINELQGTLYLRNGIHPELEKQIKSLVGKYHPDWGNSAYRVTNLRNRLVGVFVPSDESIIDASAEYFPNGFVKYIGIVRNQETGVQHVPINRSELNLDDFTRL